MSDAEGSGAVAQSDEAGREAVAGKIPGARRPAGAPAETPAETSTGAPVGTTAGTPVETPAGTPRPRGPETAARTGSGPGPQDTRKDAPVPERPPAATGGDDAAAVPGPERDTGAPATSGKTSREREDTPEAPKPAVPRPIAPSEPKPSRPRGPSRLLWQNPARTGFGPRRFRLGPARSRLEGSGQACVAGYNAVISGQTERIDDLHEEVRGFAYEGAGMACATLDVLTATGGRRLRNLLSGQGMRYPHLIHLGAGRAYARLRLRPMWGIRSVHPLLRWLAFDGFGFHQAFFSADRTIGRQRTAGLLDRTRRAIFDQGVGRTLWLHECAGVDDVIRRVAEFPAGRRADLWSGLGLAAVYAGGASVPDLERLGAAAAEDGFRAHLVQGGAFACAFRLISGTVPAHTAAAAPALCGVEVDEAGHWTDAALIALGHNAHSGDHYQTWRAGIRKTWARRNRGS